jgi:hypothetical protein
VQTVDRFDASSIYDPEVSSLYQLTLERGQEAAMSLRKAYGRLSELDAVEFFYMQSDVFGAEAQQTDSHQIRIYSPSILLLVNLFRILLGEQKLLPELLIGQSSKIDIPLLHNCSDMSLARIYPVTLDHRRARLAVMLADFCSCFISFHELGHVVLGHTAYLREHHSSFAVLEAHGSGRYPTRIADRLQSWEYDADIIAASLMAPFVVDFAAAIERNEQYRSLFGQLAPKGFLLENIVAIVSNALFCMFTYMAQAISYLNLHHGHPHPVFRNFYVRNAVVQTIGRRQHIDVRKALSAIFRPVC